MPVSLRPILRGLLAYGAAEAGTRVLRIAAIIIIARQVAPAQIGLAALALALFELVRVLANSGIGQRIIAASDMELAAICIAANRLFGWWCAAVALIQLLVAMIAWLAFGMSELAAMLAILSGVYAFMPPGLVRVFLLMREGKLATTARIAATQTAADHVLSMLLALVWPSAWALVLPKLLTAPIWLILVRRAKQWVPESNLTPAPARDFLHFGTGVLGSELVAVARQQLDKLIVGAWLGTEALGYYFFAFNAGLGITTSFISALGVVLFPHLCSAEHEAEKRRRVIQAGGLALLLFTPVIAAQVLLADFYVPILFGDQWLPVAPLVAILCLGGIPAIFGTLATAWLRATGKPQVDALFALAVTAGALLALAAGCAIGLEAAAWAYVGALWLIQLPFAAAIVLRGSGFTIPFPSRLLKGAR